MDTITQAQQAAIDAAPAPIAVLDGDGTILAVNTAWIAFGHLNGREDGTSDIGTIYPFHSTPKLRGFLESGARSISLPYPCHAPTERRWYRFVAFRVARRGAPRILILHRLLDAAPRPKDMEDAAAELSLRWEGIGTICAWCESRVRGPLGGWEDGQAEPGRTYSHGLCDACAETILPAEIA